MSRGPMDDFIAQQLVAFRQAVAAQLAQLDSLLGLIGLQLDPSTNEVRVMGQTSRPEDAPPECVCDFPPDINDRLDITTMNGPPTWMCRLCAHVQTEEAVPHRGPDQEQDHGPRG